MYAVIIDNKFTGVAYTEITDSVREWCNEMDATMIKVSAPPINVGTEDKPDYGSPTQKQLNQHRIAEIDRQLREIDIATMRPIRAIQAGTETQADTDKLTELEAQAVALREERSTLV